MEPEIEKDGTPLLLIGLATALAFLAGHVVIGLAFFCILVLAMASDAIGDTSSPILSIIGLFGFLLAAAVLLGVGVAL